MDAPTSMDNIRIDAVSTCFIIASLCSALTVFQYNSNTAIFRPDDHSITSKEQLKHERKRD